MHVEENFVHLFGWFSSEFDEIHSTAPKRMRADCTSEQCEIARIQLIEKASSLAPPSPRCYGELYLFPT